MKQYISVRAIVRKQEKTLLLRRSGGRPAVDGMYELPGGSVRYGEQPEDTLRRTLRDHAGVSVQTMQLFDVLTYIDRENRDAQFVFIVYLVSLVPQSKVSLSSKYSRYSWAKRAAIDLNGLTEPTRLLLNITQQAPTSVDDGSEDDIDDNITSDLSHVIVYSDGGSRGNPGASAAGFVIMNRFEQVQDQGGSYLGVTTNNQAEYHGVRQGLERALELGARTVDFRMDSLLVVNQLNGVYTIKNRELWPLNERIRELAGKFDKVTFSHVKREFNQLADGVVNKILDEHRGE